MTPLARYYLFVMVENDRATAAAHGIDIQTHRPSLVNRIRARAVALRGQPRLARSA